MTLKETKDLMNRVKNHFQNFSIDDEKIKEWYKFTKEYRYQDVDKELTKYLQSEETGNNIPKIAILIKGLIPESNIGKVENYKLVCPYCDKAVEKENFDKHYKRCLDIRNICTEIKRYNLDFKPDEEEIRTYDDELINKMHRRINEIVYERTTDPIQKMILGKVLYNKEIDYKQIKLGI